MCIPCGSCSTYCEMGIDVRQYAMANQDVKRAACGPHANDDSPGRRGRHAFRGAWMTPDQRGAAPGLPASDSSVCSVTPAPFGNSIGTRRR